MGTCSVFDNRVDPGIFFHLEIHQVISSSKVSHSNVAFSPDRRFPHAFSHPGGGRERSAILFPSTLGIARRCQGTEK